MVLTTRNEERGLQARETLKASGLSHLVLFHQVDVADSTSVVASLVDFIKSKFWKLDIHNFDSPFLVFFFFFFLVLNESPSEQSYKSACLSFT